MILLHSVLQWYCETDSSFVTTTLKFLVLFKKITFLNSIQMSMMICSTFRFYVNVWKTTLFMKSHPIWFRTFFTSEKYQRQDFIFVSKCTDPKKWVVADSWNISVRLSPLPNSDARFWQSKYPYVAPLTILKKNWPRPNHPLQTSTCITCP